MKDWNAESDEDFRAETRRFIRANYPQEHRFIVGRARWAELKDWYGTLHKAGWVAPSWPVVYGGMGLSPSKVIIWVEEQEEYGVARPPDQGITMVGPTIIQLGTDAQRSKYLPKILSGENIWVQGYSEPGAGSDLASLKTQAVLDGEHWVVNGQKTWTTLAQDGTHIYLLARTDPKARKQEGISFLLVDLKSKGITIRPIRNIGGGFNFCEVFFDDVRVPRENIVGEVNKGWAVAKTQLGFERLFLGSPKMPHNALARLWELAAKTGAVHDPVFLDRFVQLKLDVADLASLYKRFVDIVRSGKPLPPDVSLLKICATETNVRITNLLVETAGAAGVLHGKADFGGQEMNPMALFYYARPAPIYGGSNEIQRGIIARHVLDLPH